MKKYLALSFLLSNLSFGAVDCTKNVTETFKKNFPKYAITKVVKTGILKSGEERPYRQEEIWNRTAGALDIYEVQSAFMAGFVHVALVDPKSCVVNNLIEVSFEE